jgi:NADH dehydrogenase FAD-containing subunit
VGELAAARTPDGYVSVGSDLRVAGQNRLFALGDIAAIDANRAGVAGRQAPVVVANILADLAGEPVEQATHYAPLPPAILVPLGPAGGAGQVPGHDGPLPAEKVAELKGRDMMVGRYREIFGQPG